MISEREWWRILSHDNGSILKGNQNKEVGSLGIPMIAPQCIFAYGSSPVKISHKAIPKENTSTYMCPVVSSLHIRHSMAVHANNDLKSDEWLYLLRHSAAAPIQQLWCHPRKCAPYTTRNQSVALNSWQSKVSNLRISSYELLMEQSNDIRTTKVKILLLIGNKHNFLIYVDRKLPCRLASEDLSN